MGDGCVTFVLARASGQIDKVGQTEEQRLSRHHVISVPPQTSNFDLDLDTSNTFVKKMSVRKAKSTNPRKTAAKKAGKTAVYVCSIPGCLKSYSGASGHF
jgi:hypothetical protein